MATLDQRREGIAYGSVGAEAKAPVESQRSARVAAERRKTQSKSAEDVLIDWIDASKSKKHIQETITTKGKGGDKRRLDAENADVAARVLTSEIFDKLPLTEQTKIVGAAQKALESIPDLKFLVDQYAGDPLGLQHFLTESLRTLDQGGDIGREINARRKEILSTARQKSEKLTQAEMEAESKKTVKDSTELLIKQNDQAKKDNEIKLKEFDGMSVPPGKKFVELMTEQSKVDAYIDAYNVANGLMGASALTEAQIDAMRTEQPLNRDRFQRLETRLRAAEAARPKDGTLIANISSQMETVSNRMDLVDGVLPGFDRVATDRNRLKTEHGQIDNESTHLKEVADNLKDAKDKAEKELKNAQGKVNSQTSKDEQDYVNELKNIPQDALKNLYEKINMDNINNENIAEQEFIAKETDPMAKALMEQMRDGRWRKIDEEKFARLRGMLRGNQRFLGDHQVEKFDDGQIRTDITLLKQGQDVLVRKMITDIKDANGNRVYSDTQINQFLASDKYKGEDGTANIVTKQLLARAVQRGELKPGDQEFIESTDWGKGLMKKAKTDHAGWIEKQKRQMGFAGSTVEFFKKHPKFGWWLLLFMAYPPAAIIVGGFIAGKNVIGPIGHKQAAA